MPIPGGAVSSPPPVNSRTFSASGTNSGTDDTGALTSSVNVGAGVMVVLDIFREGVGDVTSTSTVTDNKGLTWHQQSTTASFHATPAKWYRCERWWAYCASAQTGLVATYTFFRSGGTNSTAYVIYGYGNVPKANGGTPFYSNGGANPATGVNNTSTATQITATVDPRSISAFVCLASAIYRDTGLGLADAGTGMTLLAKVGSNSSSGNASFSSIERLQNSAQGSTQACAFTPNETFWNVLADVIDAT